jgi:hypothetical protein
MATRLRGGGLSFEYQAVDIRSLDGDRLLESDEVGDNVIAILAHLRDHKEAVRKIVTRLAGLPPRRTGEALEQLFILAGLRRLEETVEREVRKMPIYIDILENKVLGREFKKGLREGRQEGELAILRRLKSASVRCHRGPSNAWRAHPLNNWRNWRRVCLTPQASKSC